MITVYKTGRCANGWTKDKGTTIHAIDGIDEKLEAFKKGVFSTSQPALCGTQLGKRSDWAWIGGLINCPRCLNKIKKL